MRHTGSGHPSLSADVALSPGLMGPGAWMNGVAACVYVFVLVFLFTPVGVVIKHSLLLCYHITYSIPIVML